MDDNFFDIKAAQVELSKKLVHQIEFEAACKWAARAYVAYMNFIKSKDARWMFDAENYWHEYLEHAALSEGKNAEQLVKIRAKVEPLRKDANLLVKKKSFI